MGSFGNCFTIEGYMRDRLGILSLLKDFYGIFLGIPSLLKDF